LHGGERVDVDIEDGVAAMEVFCGIGIDGKRVGKKVVNVMSVEWRAEELELNIKVRMISRRKEWL
jgi:hypothetical protein